MSSKEDKAHVQATLERFLQRKPRPSAVMMRGKHRVVVYATKEEEDEALRLLKEQQAAKACVDTEKMIRREYAATNRDPIFAAPGMLISPSLVRLLQNEAR